MRAVPLALVALAFAPPVAGASMVRPLALPELVARAERVVLARCLASAAAPADAGGLPATAITFAVSETLKGPVEPTVTIRQLGRPGDGPGPAFAPGQEVLLFLPRASVLGFTHPVGLAQGKLEVLRRPGRAAVVRGELPLRAAAAGAEDPDGMPLDRLLETVRGLVAAGAAR